MKCSIIDDDPVSILSISELLKEIPEASLESTYTNANEALADLKIAELDFILLDVQMPEMNGIEFIQNLGSDIQIILISSNKEYAAEGYEFNVADFIHKPVTIDRLKAAVERVSATLTSMANDQKEIKSWFIRESKTIKKVDLQDVLFVQAANDYVAIHTSTKRIMVRSKMNQIESKMPSNFIRVHRSYIINSDYLEEIEDSTLVVKGNVVPISRGYRNNLLVSLTFI